MGEEDEELTDQRALLDVTTLETWLWGAARKPIAYVGSGSPLGEGYRFDVTFFVSALEVAGITSPGTCQ
jgi:hypothetical protein